MNKKLHILFLSSWYPSRVSSQNGNFVQKHAETIASKYTVTTLFAISDINCKSKYEICQQNINDVHAIIIYFKKHTNILINGYRKLKALRLGLKMIPSFDIIHGNIINPIGLYTWYISKTYKKPYILTEHWSGYLPEDKSSLSPFRKKIIQYIIKNTSYIITVSTNLKNQMIEADLKGNYKVIGNVVDTNLFYPKQKQNQLFEIVHISNLDENSKNITGILSTIKKLSKQESNFIIKIVGIENFSYIKSIIKKLQIPTNVIELIGVKSPNEIAQILQKANLYISFSNYETFGIVMAEAIACGTPVVSTDTGILSELNLSKATTIINRNDETALLNAILKYLNSNITYDTTKMHNSIKQRFSKDQIIKEYSSIYNQIIS